MLTRHSLDARCIGGPALAILDVVVDVARRDLLSRHPHHDDLREPGDHFDAVDTVAHLLVGRLDELRDLADAYRHALANAGLNDLF
jgi:hypothetical protein